MNRKEYLKRLAEELHFLDDETRDAALAFYAEMIDDRVEDGMDELSAVKSMEEPEVIAARLRAETPESQQKQEQRSKEIPVWDDEAMEFSTLAEKIQRSVEEAMKGVPERLEKFREKVEKAGEKAEKAADWAVGLSDEFEKGAGKWQESMENHGDYEQKIFTCPSSAIQGILLSVENMPIRIYPCAEDQVKLIYYTCERDPYVAKMEEGILKLQKPETEKSRDGFGFSFFSNGMRFMFSRSSPTVELTAPSDILADLYARTSNSSIRLSGFSSLCRTELYTSNSRITLENVSCKSLEMKTCNARLEMINVRSKRFLHGKSCNDRITAEQTECGEEMTLQTSNGRISLENGQTGGEMSLITSNGSIEVYCRAAAGVTLRTSNGSIRGTLPGAQADWRIDSGTSNGKNSLPRHQMGGKQLSAHTSNGKIQLSFARESY